MSCLIEMPVSLRRRQPLIPQVYRKPELRPQLLRERLRLDRLRTLVARHIQRITDHRLRHRMLTNNPRQPLQICATVRPVQCEQWLRGVSQRVRDRQPHSPVAYIEAQNPRNQRIRTFIPINALGVGKILRL